MDIHLRFWVHMTKNGNNSNWTKSDIRVFFAAIGLVVAIWFVYGLPFMRPNSDRDTDTNAHEQTEEAAEANDGGEEVCGSVIISANRELYQFEYAYTSDFSAKNEQGETLQIEGFGESCEDRVLIDSIEQTVFIKTNAGITPCDITAVGVRSFVPKVDAYRVQAGKDITAYSGAFHAVLTYRDGRVVEPTSEEIVLTLESGDDTFREGLNTYELSYNGLSCMGSIEGLQETFVQSEYAPMTYKDLNTTIEITMERHYDTDCIVTHIITIDPDTLKTTYSEEGWGSLDKMSSVSEYANAVFMVNADWTDKKFAYYVPIVRNGEVVNYQPTPVDGDETLGIRNDGHLYRVTGDVYDEIENNGLKTTWTFRRGFIVENGEIMEKPEALATARHPRTFIGEVMRDDGLLEYYIIVADGRRSDSAGLNFDMEAAIMLGKGCSLAYNFDGGGTSEVMFDGKILNMPSDGRERRSSDFLYVVRAD